MAVSTVDTDNSMRDKSLVSDEYFDAAKFPLITLVSTKIEKTNKTDCRVLLFYRNLTIKGVTKTIAFPFQAKEENNGYLFTGNFQINRTDFGVGEQNIVLSNIVEVTFICFCTKRTDCMPLVKVFFWGMIVSFLGTLPLGTLNVAAMQISVQENIKNAILFSLGSLSVEMIYVRISLVGINWVRKQKKLFRWMEWITVAIVVALAIGSFVAAMKPHHAKNVMLNNNINRYFTGSYVKRYQPDANSFLVWLEHGSFHQKYFKA